MARTEADQRNAHWPKANWPANQPVARWAGEEIFATTFEDHQDFGGALRQTILERGENPDVAQSFDPKLGIAQTKVYDVSSWGTPEATMIDARARAFLGGLIKKPNVVTDISWASVYRTGNWVSPHSHPRTLASVLYVVDLGDDDNPLNGQFRFVDPRLKACCKVVEGCMTNPGAPRMQPGTMVCFPGKVLHMVTPYWGDAPRITMSWDLNTRKLPGSQVPEWVTRGKPVPKRKT